MSLPESSPPPAEDIRDAFFHEILRLARQDRRVMVLTDDQSAFALDQIRDELPAQYLHIGIAEQNLINVAAGLALGGLKPFVCGISNFVSLRACEQISVNLCAMNLPVTIVASGGGLTYANDGPTHQAVLDVAVMRAMPHLALWNPSDAVLTSACARLCHSRSGPAYVRIEKGVLPRLYEPHQDFSDGMALLREGHDILLVSTGYLTHNAIQVARLLQEQGVDAGVLDWFCLKPVNAARALAHLTQARCVAVLEEQTPIGGLGSLVCELLGEHGGAVPVLRFHLPDEPCHQYGSREWLHRRFGLDAAAVAHRLVRWLTAGQCPAPSATVHEECLDSCNTPA
jgi:transketolase